MLKNFKDWKESILQPDEGNISPNPAQVAGQRPQIPANTQPIAPKIKPKPWKASKTDVVNFWRSLGDNIPLHLTPIPYKHQGSSIQEDGIRITGSKEFIASTMSKLKDFLQYENNKTKLIISYRQSPKSLLPGKKDSYMFYLQVKERGEA